ncbi:MAG: hypothetical protein KGQ94_13905, partial [Alphaproteobacteria bacterium]|nr:hypothetical protein [Alphaproteobacteria bacterium]
KHPEARGEQCYALVNAVTGRLHCAPGLLTPAGGNAAHLGRFRSHHPAMRFALSFATPRDNHPPDRKPRDIANIVNSFVEDYCDKSLKAIFYINVIFRCDNRCD